MTYWHSKSNSAAPSRFDVIADGAGAALAIAVSVWLYHGSTGVRMSFGGLGWSLIAGYLLGATVSGLLKRHWVCQELARERARNTGVWRDPGGVSRFCVRHEPSVGFYLLREPGRQGRQMRQEELLDDELVYDFVAGKEEAGYQPDSDEATRLVRARLGLPYRPPARQEPDLGNVRPLFKPGPF